jgi:hypothetical protein
MWLLKGKVHDNEAKVIRQTKNLRFVRGTRAKHREGKNTHLPKSYDAQIRLGHQQS